MSNEDTTVAPEESAPLADQTIESTEPIATVGPLDLSGATPELYAALVAAQAAVETVGKTGRNVQRDYKYATAEAMIRAVRGPLTSNGLAFLSTWVRNEVQHPGGNIGNQFVCAAVRMHFVLVHTTGAMIRGSCELDAIGSAARPPDKAVAATLTFMRGFILRDLLNLDRLEEEKDAVDKRADTAGFTPRQHGGDTSDDQQAKAAARMAAAKAAAAARDKGKGAPANTAATPPATLTADQQAKVDDLRKRVSCLLGEYNDKAGVKPRNAVAKILGSTIEHSEDMTGAQLKEVERGIEHELALLEGGRDAAGDDDDAADWMRTDEEVAKAAANNPEDGGAP